MRNFGGILMLLAIIGFFYAGAQVDKFDPVPPGLSVEEGMRYPGGRWEVARYACAGLAGFGLLIAMFPKGR